MNRITLFLAGSLTLITILISCQKEVSLNQSEMNTGSGNNNPGSSALIGNWKFTGAQAEGHSVADATGSGISIQTISSLNYNTSNNTGTLKIEATKMSYTNFSYTATGLMKVDIYQGSNLDTLSVPIDFSLPASSTSANYQQIGIDSIYCPGGGLISISGVGNIPQQANGAKFKIENGKLTITATVVQNQSDNSVPGVTQTIQSVMKGTFTFQKL